MKFDLRNEASDTIALDIFDQIGEGFLWSGVTARDVLAKLQPNRGAKTIDVRIHSKGGDVLEGLAIYTVIAQHPARVIVNIDGVAASMASAIAMAGDEIRMAPAALMMLHNPWGVARGEAADLRAVADILDKMQSSLAAIYSLRAGLKTSEVIAMMDAETWLSADEAKAKGFATAITQSAPKTRAERNAMQSQPIIPQVVARAGLTSRYAELAKRILSERDPAALAKLLEQRDALMTEAEGGAPRAAAEGTGGPEYAKLTAMQRHQLKERDPKAFERMRAEHYQRVEDLRLQANACTDITERRRLFAELERITTVPTA